jgi:DNA-packaging protein gp3
MIKKRLFASAKALDALIAQYFELTDSEDQPENCAKKTSARKTKSTDEKVRLHEPGFPTFNGLAHYLGFASLGEFEEYEARSRFGTPLKRARLRIAAIYEKKLHTHSYGGAAYALKISGWNDRSEDKVSTAENDNTMKVEIVQSGIKPASSEKEVVM